MEKAESDFHSMQREMRSRKNPNFDLACFLAQQCAEKYLKARLVEANLAFSKTHNLVDLLEIAKPVEPVWIVFRQDLAFLTDFAVRYRYPGSSASRKDATDARSHLNPFRKAARASLRLT